MSHIYFLDKDEERLSLFPNLDYKDLYDTLYDFIPDMQYVTNPGIIAKSQSFFHVSSRRQKPPSLYFYKWKIKCGSFFVCHF